MAVKLNHTIVHASDKRASADFYAQVFGLDPPVPFGPFLDVQTANGVTLAIFETDERFDPQHYAFGLGLAMPFGPFLDLQVSNTS
jgi:hypothetical protein